MASPSSAAVSSRAGLHARRAILKLLVLASIGPLAAVLAPAAAAAHEPSTTPTATSPAVSSVRPNIVLSGDWPQFHNTPDRQGNNIAEQVLGPADVAGLRVASTGLTGFGVFTSPAVANGVAYVGSEDHKLYAFAVGCASGGGTCTPLWTATTGSYVFSSPAVANGVVYVGSDDHKLYAFDAAGVIGCSGVPKTCLPLWTATTGGVVYSSPAVSGGIVYVGSEDNNLYAYDAAGITGCSGSPVVCTPLWTAPTGNYIAGAVAVAGGVVYTGSSDGILRAFAVGCSSGGGTCTPLWTGATAGSIWSSPTVAGGVVYTGSNDGKLYAFAVGCSSGGGSCSPLWTGTTGAAVESAPAVAGGVVYVGSDDHKLYAFAVGCSSGGGNCSPVWTGTTGANVFSSPAIANGVVYVGSNDAKLYAYAVGCGTAGAACSPLWTATTGGALYSSPAVVDGVVYVGSMDAKLYAFDIEGGIYRTAATYHAIAPARVLDTRATGGVVVNMGLTGRFTAGTFRTFHVANAVYVGGGSAVAAPAGATAVTGNLTIVGETAAGVIALGPSITATGQTTTINFVTGDVRANNVTIGLAPDGTLSAVFRSATVGATTQLIFDVTGYFTPNATGATYHAVTPGRILDTRPTNGGHTNIGLAGKFASKAVRTFNVSGVTGLGWGSALVPGGAIAVTGNVTVTNATSDGFVSVGPTMIAVPSTSTINIKAGKNSANGVTVALSGGKLQAVWVGKAGSSTDVIFDVTGYFTADLTGLSYHPIFPARYLDSSTGRGLSGSFATGTPRTLTVGHLGQVLLNAAGISGNLTLVNPSAAGWVQVAPTISGTPTSSTVNATAHQTVANGFDVPLSGSISVALIWVGGASSTANLQLDVTGYWK